MTKVEYTLCEIDCAIIAEWMLRLDPGCLLLNVQFK